MMELVTQYTSCIYDCDRWVGTVSQATICVSCLLSVWLQCYKHICLGRNAYTLSIRYYIYINIYTTSEGGLEPSVRTMCTDYSYYFQPSSSHLRHKPCSRHVECIACPENGSLKGEDVEEHPLPSKRIFLGTTYSP